MVWRVMHRTGMWTGWMLTSGRGCILLMIVRVISRRWMSCVLNGDESLRASKIQDENALNASFEPQKSILCLPPRTVLPPPLIGNARTGFQGILFALRCQTKQSHRSTLQYGSIPMNEGGMYSCTNSVDIDSYCKSQIQCTTNPICPYTDCYNMYHQITAMVNPFPSRTCSIHPCTFKIPLPMTIDTNKPPTLYCILYYHPNPPPMQLQTPPIDNNTNM